jgi:4-oxalocrotonate tautomerase
MPIITIKLAKGRSLEQKRQLAKALTEAATTVLAVEPEWISVLIDEYDRENWATGGELHADKFGPGFGSKIA